MEHKELHHLILADLVLAQLPDKVRDLFQMRVEELTLSLRCGLREAADRCGLNLG